VNSPLIPFTSRENRTLSLMILESFSIRPSRFSRTCRGSCPALSGYSDLRIHVFFFLSPAMATILVRKWREKNKSKSPEPCHHQWTEGMDLPLNDRGDHAKAGNAQPPQQLAQLNNLECELCKSEKHRARIYRWKLIFGLLFPYMLSSLDLTVVATALPFIASHFSREPSSERHDTVLKIDNPL